MSHRAARPVVALLLAAAAAACGGSEKKVVDNYVNAGGDKANPPLGRFAAVPCTEPVRSWQVQGTRDGAPVPATLPQLATRMKDLESQAAAAKKEWDGYKLQHYADLTKVDEAKKKGGAV